MSNALRIARSGARRLLDWLLPQDCFVCGEECGAARVCERCAGELPTDPLSCPVCAVPTTDGDVCGRCLRDRPAFDATRAIFAYRFPLDRMVQALKYRNRLALAGFFTDAMRPFRPPGEALIVPMPLHRRRLRERGFNQAVEIARPLARAWSLPLGLTAVTRTVHTPPQASLPWRARSVNIRGAFRCEAALDGKTVIVIDDVMTTGATLDELARTLKLRGAARVENLVVARTPPPG